MNYDPANPYGLTMQGLESVHAEIEHTLKTLKEEHGEGLVIEALIGVISLGDVLDPARVKTCFEETLAFEAEMEPEGIESGVDDWQDNASKPLQGFSDDLGGRFDEGVT